MVVPGPGSEGRGRGWGGGQGRGRYSSAVKSLLDTKSILYVLVAAPQFNTGPRGRGGVTGFRLSELGRESTRGNDGTPPGGIPDLAQC